MSRPPGLRLDAAALEKVLIDALEVLPDATLVEDHDWVQLITPSSPFPHHNKVLRARLDPAEVDRRIARVRDAHLARGAGLRWVVGPGSRPDTLSERLEAAGVALLAAGSGMVRSTSPDVPAIPAEITLRRVGRHEVAQAADVTARGWEKPPAFATGIREWMDRTLDAGREDLLFWLADLEGKTVGACTLRLLPGVGYMQGASVIPSARGRGVYRAMTWQRLELLKERGLGHAVIWTNDETSGPIARAMGFEPLCTARFHELPIPE